MQTPFSEGTAHLWKGSMWHVEVARDSLITAGNGGSEPTHAALTLFYNNGKSSYTIEKLLEPEEQLWADVGEIVRDQIPDKNGKTIPPDVTMGSYELRDLDHLDIGSLYEGKLVLDKTWGHGYYGCSNCCGYTGAWMDPNPFSGTINTGGWNEIGSMDCTDTEYDFTSKGYNWRSLNTAVVTLTSPYTNFVGVGSTSGFSSVGLASQQRNCPVQTSNPQSTQKTLPCPASVTLVKVPNASLANNYPPYRTGIGGFAEMSVGPAKSTTYNGTQITETVKQDAATTCPAGLLSQPAFKGACSGNSTFTVGGDGGTQFGVVLGQINNAFWDQHLSTDGADDMGVAGYTTTCKIVCDQTYSCSGKQIGSFTITRTISHTTVGSNPAVSATNVAVMKQ